MASITTKLLMCAALCIVQIHSEEDLRDFDFDSDPEIMIAQESRQYQTIVKAPFKPSKTPIKILKPNGITNSHRPQYNIDSEEEMKTHRSDSFMDLIETTTKKTFEKGYPGYQTSYKWRSKEGMIREAVLRALERKDHVGRFAQILPIIRSMSGAQRGALASLVAHQVTTPPGRAPLNLAQVRSMFGNHENTSSELMLPILLDMAKMIRRAVGPGKEPRAAPPAPQLAPHNMIRRSSIDDDTLLDNDPFETYEDTTTTKAPRTQQNINRSRARNRVRNAPAQQNRTAVKETKDNTVDSDTKKDDVDDDDTHKTTPQMSPSSSTTEPSTSPAAARSLDNGTLDLAADATNQTLVDLPTAEKLRAFNRYVDRKGNHIHRGNFPKPSPAPSRRSTPEPGSMGPSGPSGSAGSVGSAGSKPRRRPAPARKLPAQASDGKCELFTNSLCLHTEDYPTDLIIQSIRRNKAAAGALLADYRDPGDGAVDGVSAQQEAQYTPEHYLVSNRRGDTASRDFASAGEAGFMCPSTVKYARPQRARATSGQWKYIVNTGEHTQTLRLEKCLKPKDSCTYLTDNFKSKCVQVYNYHRLLTWDQQNGLHMDIFKVPTCCSCHIEGYSVNFPPLGHRVHETSSAESFPGEDLSAEHGNGAFESVQPSIKRPSIAKTPPFAVKPLETFPSIGENHNIIPGNNYPMNLDDHDGHASNPMDSYGNSYFPDSFNQASNNVRNVKRPPSARHPAGATGADGKTLPSYLEPPTPAAPSSFSFMKEPTSKYKITNSNHFKRGAPRPNRRPIRKTISGAPDDLVSSGTSAVESHPANIESLEDFNDDLEEPDIITANNPPSPATIAPKLPAVEPSSTTARPQEPTNNHNNRKPAKKDSMNNGKRVNYNYHPIIDFFEEDKKSSSIDREDTMAEYMPAAQSEWKPIDHPVSRSKPNNNLVGRRKH